MTALERAAISVQEAISDAFFDSVEPDPKEIARAVLLAVRDLGEVECERVRGCFPGQDVMADTLFALSIDAILNEKDTTND